MPFNILPKRMKFNYSIHFHEQLHLTVGNTIRGASATWSCWGNLTIIKTDEFQLEMWQDAAAFPLWGDERMGCLIKATVAFEVFLEFFQSSCQRSMKGNFFHPEMLPATFSGLGS